MRERIVRRPWWSILAFGVSLLSLVLLPAASAQQQVILSTALLNRVSHTVAVSYWLSNPAQAPAQFQARLGQLRQSAAQPQADLQDEGPNSEGAPLNDRFNRDRLGLPQNEESVVACRSNPDVVLGGTNDYRGLLDPVGNFTGWHLSLNGGNSVANEGRTPPIDGLASQGDPVSAADKNCNLYAADLNFSSLELDAGMNGVGVYRSNATTLAACAGDVDPTCWPTRRLVARNEQGHFLDKPWMDVGESGNKGTIVWVTYTDFHCSNPNCDPPFTNQIKAVRCNADLSQCTSPIVISGDQDSIQFSDVTIGPDGRTYITWEEDNDLSNNFQPPEHMRFWLRVAPAGSTEFGPARLVAEENLNMGIADLHANDFRVATYPKNAVRLMANGRPRIFVVWDGCRQRILGDTVCEEPQIKLRYSDDDGRNWSDTKILSVGGDNYFPTIANDAAGSNLAVAWYTSRQDTIFHNRQDVELATVDPVSGNTIRRELVTGVSNEPEADPLLGGSFIGDYFEVFAHKGQAYVHYNANYHEVRVLGEGLRIPQQDNYLSKKEL